MRDTVDFGIDLGTTNSAIAVFSGGEAVVIKNNDGWDYTPSAVWIPEPGEVHVGRTALDNAHVDPENAATEFKLGMGMADAGRRFANAGLTLTPPQLSAEVLKSLRADVESAWAEEPQCAVITVPAAFQLHQNHATGEAAALAGLGSECPLVQEPTAAAFAYGLADRSDKAYWMVFDFGGGTFDAAVVSKREGKLMVLNHSGDPNLGGKLIDWAVVEQLLAPVVAAAGLADFTRDNPAWRANFAKLKRAAEEAKIQLSRKDSHRLTCTPPLTDARGQAIRLEYVLRRDELDRVAEPFYARAIACCRNALTEGNLRPDAIDRLLLVGGVTLAPGLRARLADPAAGLGIPLDHSQDPRTVVARGAAIFARTVPIPRAPARPKAGEFTVELKYQRVTASTEPVVAGRLHGTPQAGWADYGIILAGPDHQPPFRSARIAVRADGTFIADLVVSPGTTSRFTIELTDSTGSRQKLTPDSLEITHGLEFGGAVLTHSLGIGQADGSFAPMLRKGAKLPARARATFSTTVALSRHDAESVVRIPAFEGTHRRADRNRNVATLQIRPRDAKIDVPLGSDIDVTVEVDESRRVSVVADVPVLRQQFEAEADLNNVRIPTPEELERRLTEVQARIAALRTSALAAGSEPALRLLDDLNDSGAVAKITDELGAARVDAGAASACEMSLFDIQAALDDVEQAVRLPEKLAEVTASVDQCRELVTRLGDPGDRRELADLESRLAQGVTDAETADALLTRANQLMVSLLRRTGELDVLVFYGFRNDRHLLSPARSVDGLIREGEQAIACDDRSALSAVNERLYRLWPPDKPLPSGSDVVQKGR